MFVWVLRGIKSVTQCSNVEDFNCVLEYFHGSSQKKCLGRHWGQNQLYFRDKGWIWNVPLQRQFSCLQPEIVCSWMAVNQLKRRYFLIPWVIRKLMFCSTSFILRVILSVLLFTTWNGHRNSPRNILKLNLKCVWLLFILVFPVLWS